MSQLKIGDLCEILDHAKASNGEKVAGLECVITGPEEWYHGGQSKPVFAYKIEIPSIKADLITACRSTLRLKRPKQWDDWLTDTRHVKDEHTHELQPTEGEGRG